MTIAYRRRVGKLIEKARRRLPDKPYFAAEIGVWRGDCSRYLLQRIQDMTLLMIDPWQPVTEDDPWKQSGDTCAITDPREIQRVYRRAMEQTQFAAGRRVVMPLTSEQAAGLIHPDSLIAVFVDGRHISPWVDHDIAHWWSKVVWGGVFCGHDYADPRFPDVTRAVDEFAEQFNLPLQTWPDQHVWAIQRCTKTAD